MLVLADSQAAILPFLSIAIGLIGLGGLVFTALRFRRDDTTAIVTQQSTLMDDMKALNDELRTTTVTLRTERDELKTQVDHLTGQVDALRVELHNAQAQLTGKVARIERRLDDSA
jgi:uncharacterized coiled-coil DUF342 family protein